MDLAATHPLLQCYPFLSGQFLSIPRACPPPPDKACSRQLLQQADCEADRLCIRHIASSQSSQPSFSIERILGKACESQQTKHEPMWHLSADQQRHALEAANYLWLQQIASLSSCSVMSANRQLVRRDTKKRKLGRNPRIPFTLEQIESLERKYAMNHYLSSLDVVMLSKQLDLSEARVKIWFQNRRARERRDKKGEDHSRSQFTAGHSRSRLPESAPSESCLSQNSMHSSFVNVPTDSRAISPHAETPILLQLNWENDV